MRKGITNVTIYYAVGLLLTILTYLVGDNSYAHGPSLYHVVALVTFYGGIGWTIVTVFRFAFYERTEKRKGIIFANLIILTALYAAFYFTVIRPYSRTTEIKIPDDTLTTTTNGDTTTISDNGRIVYMKVRDSVHIDFMQTKK
jgi:hypothetical protein